MLLGARVDQDSGEQENKIFWLSVLRSSGWLFKFYIFNSQVFYFVLGSYVRKASTILFYKQALIFQWADKIEVSYYTCLINWDWWFWSVLLIFLRVKFRGSGFFRLILCYPLSQQLANYVLWAIYGPPLVFANKLLLQHSAKYLFMCCLCPLLHYKGKVEYLWQRP